MMDDASPAAWQGAPNSGPKPVPTAGSGRDSAQDMVVFLDETQQLSPKTLCEREVQLNGPSFRDKRGRTLLHQYLLSTPPDRLQRLAVYSYAHLGVPINAQDHKNGDTALHIAVKADRPDIVEALFLCGANPRLRNKYALSAFDMLTPANRLLQRCNYLQLYQGGLLDILNSDSPAKWTELAGSWFALNTVIEEKLTGYEVGVRQCQGPHLEQIACLEALRRAKPGLDFVHCVLTDDVEGAARLLAAADRQRGSSVNVNARHLINKAERKYGRNLLSVAVLNNSLPLVRLLLENGARADELAVPRTLEPPLPVFHLALEAQLDMAIFKELVRVLPQHVCHVRNWQGNTLLFEAVEQGRSLEDVRFVLEQVTHREGLLDRNQASRSIKEVAAELHMPGLVSLVDEVLTDLFASNNRQLLLLLASFGFDHAFFHIPNFFAEDYAPFLQSIDKLQEQRKALYEAIADGDLNAVKTNHTALFRDKNGYSPLIKAIAHGKMRIAEWLLSERPELRGVPDNSNRYPLHYAYALARDTTIAFADESCAQLSERFVKLLVRDQERKPEASPIRVEAVYDLNGVIPLEYRSKMQTADLTRMLQAVRECHLSSNTGERFEK